MHSQESASDSVFLVKLMGCGLTVLRKKILNLRNFLNKFVSLQNLIFTEECWPTTSDSSNISDILLALLEINQLCHS